jgi:3-deoxy-D-arabino-heptulosonate 7-phosphate (DAHP) synthase class II
MATTPERGDEADLARNYTSASDPRLNYGQAMEMSFRLARRMAVHNACG